MTGADSLYFNNFGSSRGGGRQEEEEEEGKK